MKKFKFRLQKILEFRHTLTKEKERELARRNAELKEAEMGVDMILELQNTASNVEEGVMTMAELTARGEYFQALQESLIKQRILVEEATQAVELAREAYREKAIEEESLESLKEKRLAEHKEARNKAERKELDSLVVQRYRFGK